MPISFGGSVKGLEAAMFLTYRGNLQRWLGPECKDPLHHPPWTKVSPNHGWESLRGPEIGDLSRWLSSKARPNSASDHQSSTVPGYFWCFPKVLCFALTRSRHTSTHNCCGSGRPAPQDLKVQDFRSQTLRTTLTHSQGVDSSWQRVER